MAIRIIRITARKRNNRGSVNDGSENTRIYLCCVNKTCKNRFHSLVSSMILIGNTALINLSIEFALRSSSL